MVNILLPKKVNTDNIVIEKSKSMREGGGILSAKVGYISDKTGEADRFIIQTPRLRCPFGINNDEKFGDGTKWDIRLSFQGEERNEKIKQFRECMKSINEKIISTCVERSKEWLNDEDIDKKMASKFFKSSIKASKKEDFADMFRIAIPFSKDEETGEQHPRKWIEFYSEDNSVLEWSPNAVSRGSEVICLFEINGVWASPGTTQYGLSVKLVQLKVFKPKQLVGLQILNDDDDEENQDDDSIQDEVEEKKLKEEEEEEDEDEVEEDEELELDDEDELE